MIESDATMATDAAFRSYALRPLPETTWSKGKVFAAEGFEQLNPWEIDWCQIRQDRSLFTAGQVIKVSRVRTVVTVETPERIFLKRAFLKNGNWVQNLLYQLRTPKEKREIESAAGFKQAGLIVPEPVYYAQGTQDRNQPVTFLAVRALPESYLEVKSYFLHERKFEKPWEALARFTRALHKADVLHADYRADHLFFSGTPTEANGLLTDFALIDLDGSHHGCPVPRHSRERALQQLFLSLIPAGLSVENAEHFLSLYDKRREFALSAHRLYAAAMEKYRKKSPAPPTPARS